MDAINGIKDTYRHSGESFNAGVLPVEPRSLHKSVNTLEPYIPQVTVEFAGGITRVLLSAKRVQGLGGLVKGI